MCLMCLAKSIEEIYVYLLKQSMPRQGTEITVTKQGTEINQKQSMPRQGTEIPMNSVGALSTTKQSMPRQGTEILHLQ